MKKIFFILFIMCLLLAFYDNKFINKIYLEPKKCNIILSNNYANLCDSNHYKYINMGGKIIVEIPLYEIKNISKLFNDFDGISIEYKCPNFDIDLYCNTYDYKCVNSYSVKNIKVFELFNESDDNFIESNNIKINLQICQYEEGIKVGYPLILDSF